MADSTASSGRRAASAGSVTTGTASRPSTGGRRTKPENDHALAVIEKYVKRLVLLRHPYVVALQESPDDENQVRAMTGGHACGNGGIVLLSSEPFLRCEVHNRFVMGVISFVGSEVAIFDYHGHSHAEPLSDKVRGGFASEYRWIFDNLAGACDVVVLGDFNARPMDHEVSHRACFSFHRRDEDPDPRTLRSHHSRPRKDMRSVAPPDEVGATYYYDTGEGAVFPFERGGSTRTEGWKT
jgi:hypothetical protein